MKNFSINSQKALEEAKRLASFSGNIIDSIHLLIGLISVKDCLAYEILVRLGLNSEILHSYLIKTENKSDLDVVISPIVNEILEFAQEIADRTTKKINSQHILLALSYNKRSSASKILLRHNITYDMILSIVEGIEHNKIEEKSNGTSMKKIESELGNNDLAGIRKYGIELVEKAKTGEILPLIGREKEIDRIIRVLSRTRKNNPIIVGESGVGKTAIVEGLAIKIANNDVPETLKNKKIFSLNVNSIIAGTKYRGELEEKFENVVNVIRNNKIILFIDEMHMITNVNNENGLNISSILKPALTNSDLSVIGATTLAEYSKYIEKDGAFERRFIKIQVDEPSEEETIRILLGLRKNFELHYDINISDEVIIQSVKLSNRYVTNKFLPDKAIDIIDEACSKKILEKKKTLTVDDINVIVTEITGIPLQKISEDEAKRLLNIESYLNKKIIGQENAIKAIASTIRRSYAGFRPKNRPIGSFIFLGTTGVGKTETAKRLGEFLFGDENSIIRFDMSEYMEKSSVSRLIGASPGYVGYENGGSLTEQIKFKPYSIILFDEIEKAHPDVFNILLQILDDGRLTDGKGRTVNFKNTIIIMTTNVGSEKVYDSRKIGFNSSNFNVEDDKREQISALKKIMRPELINRIDNVIVFNKLSKEDICKITNNIIESKKQNLFDEKGINLEFNDSLIKYIVKDLNELEYGARPIRRKIEKLLEDKLSEVIIKKDLRNANVKIIIDDGIKFVFKENQEVIYEN